MYGSLQSLRDFSERLELNHLVKLDSEEYMMAFVESMPIPCWIKDTYGVMRFLNNAYEKIYDVRKDNYIGKTDDQVWPPEIAEAFKKRDDEVYEGKVVKYTVEKVPNRAGFRQYDHLNVIKFPLYKGPEVVGIAGLVTGVFP